jgi:hypothetical protein
MQEPEIQKEIADLISRKESRSRWLNFLLVAIIGLLGLTTIYYGKKAQRTAVRFEMLSDTLRVQRDELAKAKADLDSSRLQIEAARDSLKAILLQAQSTLEKYDTKESREIQDKITKEIVVTDKKGYIIYIHAYGRDGQIAAKNIFERLNRGGYPAKGIEVMKAPFTSRVTYFHQEDLRASSVIGKWAVEECLKINPRFRTESMAPTLSSLRAPTKQIEIWINMESRPEQKDVPAKELIDKEKQYK